MAEVIEATAIETTETKRRGRPPGAATKTKPVVETRLSRCPVCGSTARTDYVNRREQAFNGPAPDGRPCDVVVWRNTTCRNCGQLRVDKSYELRATAS
jgi:RNA polymerase subunit RPABC4/transcription elongation factor Spt4